MNLNLHVQVASLSIHDAGLTPVLADVLFAAAMPARLAAKGSGREATADFSQLRSGWL
jgi:hypothetical protein